MADVSKAPEVKQGAGVPPLPGNAAEAPKPEGSTGDNIGDTATKAAAEEGFTGSGAEGHSGLVGSGAPGEGDDVNRPGAQTPDPNNPLEEGTAATGHPEPELHADIEQDNVTEPGVGHTTHLGSGETFSDDPDDVEDEDGIVNDQAGPTSEPAE